MRKVFLFYFITISLIASAQTEPPHPKFENFIGDAYRMQIVERPGKNGRTIKSLVERYGDHVYDYPKIGQVNLPGLNIPETNVKEGQFPGIEQKTQFAMVLHSKMTTTLKACYEFSLNSDDGSVLWIDGKEVVNNDGGHQMTLKMDSLVYEPGTYDVKVWYFQSLPDRFGITLDAKIVGRPDVCPSAIPEIASKSIKFSLDSKVYFDSGSAQLKSTGEEALQKMTDSISDKNPQKIRIIGHTDSIGNERANQILSQQRAESIAAALRQQMDVTELNIIVEGMGEELPIADNTTKEGRAQNRRVEIIVE